MAYQPFSNKDIRGFFGLFWLSAFVLLQFTLQYFFDISWVIALTDNFISILLIILCIGLINRGNYILEMKGYQIIPLLIIVTILTIVEIAVNITLLYSITSGYDNYHSFLWNSIPFRLLYTWFIITGFTFMNYVWNRASERDEELKKAENLRKMAKDAELDKIYQQIQPHFLFNSLNAIDTLILSYPENASNMVQNLSEFLRGSLKRIDDKNILFEDEIKHLSLYLELENMRFGDRLITDLHIKKSAYSASIPPLIIQPLIENAIKFGLYGTLGVVAIRLESFVLGGYLFLLLSNPFDEDAQPPKGTGFGLKSVKRRLYLTYGRDDLIQTHSKKNKFVTILKIPQNTILKDEKSDNNR